MSDSPARNTYCAGCDRDGECALHRDMRLHPNPPEPATDAEWLRREAEMWKKNFPARYERMIAIAQRLEGTDGKVEAFAEQAKRTGLPHPFDGYQRTLRDGGFRCGGAVVIRPADRVVPRWCGGTVQIPTRPPTAAALAGMREQERGAAARREGRPQSANPHSTGTDAHEHWKAGWLLAAPPSPAHSAEEARERMHEALYRAWKATGLHVVTTPSEDWCNLLDALTDAALGAVQPKTGE